MDTSEILHRVSFAHVCGDAMIGAAAGLGLYSSFPPLGWWWMTIPALALFISRIDEARAPRALAVTLIFGMSMWLPLIDWVPMAVGMRTAWFALAFVQTLFWCVWVVFTRWTQLWSWARGPVLQALLYAVSWAGVDAARSRWPWSGFPWGSVALPPALALLVLVGIAAPGAISLSNMAEEGMLRVGVVQGDIALPGPQAYSHPGEVTMNNVRASRQLAADPAVIADPIDIALWGEGSVDRDPIAFARIGELVDEAATALDAPILIGYTNLNERERVKNWLALWEPGAGIDEQARYSKHVPVPFGEFIPLREFIASFATEVARASKDMEAGEEPPLMAVSTRDGREVPLAVGICFEGAYPSVIGQGVALGGQMIVTPSNNYHFRSSGESAQQGQLLRMRAMEYSRSAIQSSTTGHSYIIRPDGSVLASTDTETAATMVADVPLRSSMTLTARAGERIPNAVMGFTAVIAVMGLVTRIRRGVTKRAARAASR